jgi:spore coat polysaccharide biosynthesis protein SpsF
MKQVTAIIQARLGSTRLPGKTLMEIEGESLLGHLLSRVRASKLVNDIIIATTDEKRDDPIVEFARNREVNCYQGSENDVLDRFYQVASEFKVENIVRITPDCPMLDPVVMDSVISKYVDGGYDYVSNTITPTFPDGLDTEVFSFAALEKAWKEAALPSEREHVTAFIVNHPELFSHLNVAKQGKDLSWMRWTVDTGQDLEFAKKIFAELYSPDKIFYMDEIISLLERKPELLDLNRGISRNEGFLKSLLKDEENTRL